MSTNTVQVAVSGGVAQQVQQNLPALVQGQIASRIAAHDATLWGPGAEAEASIRLGWTGLHHDSQQLLSEILQLRAALVA